MKKILLTLIIAGFTFSSFAASTESATVATTQSAKNNASGVISVAPSVVAAKKTESSGSIVTIADKVDCGATTACMVVSDTTKRALELINKDAPTQIASVVASQFDFTLMTKYAMGNNWKQATPDQQAKLVSLFKQLLIYTYSTAVSKFKDAKTNIVSATVSTPDPKKPEIQKTAVISQVTLPDSGSNTPIKVEYDLANNTGTWKAYDIKIENASLVTTYRTQFNDVVQTSKVVGLIKQLQDKVDSLQKSKSSDQ